MNVIVRCLGDKGLKFKNSTRRIKCTSSFMKTSPHSHNFTLCFRVEGQEMCKNKTNDEKFMAYVMEQAWKLPSLLPPSLLLHKRLGEKTGRKTSFLNVQEDNIKAPRWELKVIGDCSPCHWSPHMLKFVNFPQLS